MDESKELRQMEDIKYPSYAAINHDDVEIGVNRERGRILKEIEDTLVCWSYPESDVADVVRCVLLNLGTEVVGGEHGTGSEEAMRWMEKVEDVIDKEYAEMELHFANLRRQRRKKVLTITSTILCLLSGISYAIYRLFRNRT